MPGQGEISIRELGRLFFVLPLLLFLPRPVVLARTSKLLSPSPLFFFPQRSSTTPASRPFLRSPYRRISPSLPMRFRRRASFFRDSNPGQKNGTPPSPPPQPPRGVWWRRRWRKRREACTGFNFSHFRISSLPLALPPPPPSPPPPPPSAMDFDLCGHKHTWTRVGGRGFRGGGEDQCNVFPRMRAGLTF